MNKMCRTNTQSGRSMIEMLGVLAIIGVLSVGGIAGYSKAMMKYRINKTIDQVTQISQNVRTLYARYKQYRNLNERIAYKANLAPKEMFYMASRGVYDMNNDWGGFFSVHSTGFDVKSFTVETSNLPNEACIELATQDWGNLDTTGLISVSATNGDVSDLPTEDDLVGNCSGKIGNGYAIACSGGSVVSIPMPVEVAVDACGNNKGNIMWIFQ